MTTKDIYGFEPEKGKLYALIYNPKSEFKVDTLPDTIRYIETRTDGTPLLVYYPNPTTCGYSASVVFEEYSTLEKIDLNKHDISKIPLKVRIAIKRGTYYDS